MRLFRLCALALFVVFAGGASPATTNPSTYTWHEYNRELLELNKRRLAGAYREHAKHGACDDAALKFLDDAAVYFTYNRSTPVYRDVEPLPRERLIAMGQGVVDAGCDDPLVAYCLGEVLDDAGQRDKAIACFRAAPARLQELHYPALRLWLAARRVADLEPNTDAGRAARDVADEAVVPLASGKLNGVERREVLRALRPYLNVMRREEQLKLIERLRGAKDADPWLADVIEGRVEVDLAWDKRTGAAATNVSPEGWAGFYEHLSKARDLLTRAWQLAPNLPEPPTEMIVVAMGGGKRLHEDKQVWFDRAEAAQLDFSEAYDAMFNALLPRWGGNHNAMYAMGLHGAQTLRLDTDAPWQLIRAVQKIARDTGEGWNQLSTPGIYDQLREVADTYATFHEKRAGRGEGNGAWYRTCHAALAWRAGRYPEGRRVLDKLGDRVDLDAFHTVDAHDPAAAASELFARTGKNADAVERAASAIARREWPAALAIFQGMIAPGADSDPRERPYVERQIHYVARRVALAAGEPVQFEPDASMEGWAHFNGGQWRVSEDGKSLVGRMTETKWPFLRLNEEIGHRFEISGVAAHTKGGPARAALLIASRARPSRTWIVMYDQAIRVILPSGENKTFKRKTREQAKFLLHYDDGMLSVSVDGQTLLDREPMSDLIRAAPYFALGVADDTRGEASFRDLVVRRIMKAGAIEDPADASDIPPPEDNLQN